MHRPHCRWSGLSLLPPDSTSFLEKPVDVNNLPLILTGSGAASNVVGTTCEGEDWRAWAASLTSEDEIHPCRLVTIVGPPVDCTSLDAGISFLHINVFPIFKVAGPTSMVSSILTRYWGI